MDLHPELQGRRSIKGLDQGAWVPTASHCPAASISAASQGLSWGPSAGAGDSLATAITCPSCPGENWDGGRSPRLWHHQGSPPPRSPLSTETPAQRPQRDTEFPLSHPRCSQQLPSGSLIPPCRRRTKPKRRSDSATVIPQGSPQPQPPALESPSQAPRSRAAGRSLCTQHHV